MAVDLWLPQDVAKEQQVDGQLQLARYWSKVVKTLDPELSLVLAGDRAQPPLVPGRWHVRRRNQGAPDSYMPVTGPEGEYREPDEQMLVELRRRDSWRTADALDRMLADKHRDVERQQRELKREQLRDHAAEDFRAARRVAGDEALEQGRKAWGRGGKT